MSTRQFVAALLVVSCALVGAVFLPHKALVAEAAVLVPSTSNKSWLPRYPSEIVARGTEANRTTPRATFVQMMCTDFEAPKHVAVCLAGSARSLPNQLVLQSVKENLFGESFGIQMTPFLHVARRDARGDPYNGNSDVFPDWREDQIRSAAGFLNIADEDTKIIDGPDVPLPTCSEYKEDFENREKAEKYAIKVGAMEWNHAKTLTYIKALAGTLWHRKGCMDLINAKEQKQGSKFNLVIMARADLTYYLPLRPYCLYNLDVATDATIPGRRYSDWFFMVPRDAADDLFIKPYTDFYGCTRNLKLGNGIESYVKMNAVGDNFFPVMVTRKPDAENSLCHVMNVDVTGMDADTCHKLIDQNAYNSYR